MRAALSKTSRQQSEAERLVEQLELSNVKTHLTTPGSHGRPEEAERPGPEVRPTRWVEKGREKQILLCVPI